MKCFTAAVVLASLLALASAAAVEKRANYPAFGPAALHVPANSITPGVSPRGTADVGGAIIIADELTPNAVGDRIHESSYLVFPKEVKVASA
ncbi:hypothetical protein GGG16DRAFT_118113 [Schizophyllum commune]